MKSEEKNLPKWVEIKKNINNHIDDELIMIGQLGVDFVNNGMLPNGNPYEWKNIRIKNRKFKRR